MGPGGAAGGALQLPELSGRALVCTLYGSVPTILTPRVAPNRVKGCSLLGPLIVGNPSCSTALTRVCSHSGGGTGTSIVLLIPRVSTLQWRRDFDVDGLEGENFPPQLEAGGRISGHDRAGNPVSTFRAARCGVAWGVGPGVHAATSRMAQALIP